MRQRCLDPTMVAEEQHNTARSTQTMQIRGIPLVVQ